MYVMGAYRAALIMQHCHRAATWLGQVSNRVLEQQQHFQQGYGVAWLVCFDPQSEQQQHFQ